MAKIPRPPKQGNTQTYVAKVAAGYTKILAGEVDADFDTIYNAWNSGTDTANLKDGSVTGPKLAADAVGPRELADGAVFTNHLQDLAVTTVKLHDGAVTNVKVSDVAWPKITGAPTTFPPSGAAGGDLAGSYPNPTLRPGAVTAAAIAPGSITATQIASGTITGTQIAPGAIGATELTDGTFVNKENITVSQSVWDQQSAGQDNQNLTLGLGTETLLAEVPWNSRGGYWIASATVAGMFNIAAGGGINGNITLRFRLKLDGTPSAADGTLLQEQFYPCGVSTSTGAQVQYLLPIAATLFYSGGLASVGTHRIKLTALQSAAGSDGSVTLKSWRVIAMEQA